MHQLIGPHTLTQTGFANQRRSMFCRLLQMDLPAHNHATVDVQHHVQAHELPAHRAGQVGDVPAPNLVGSCGHPGLGGGHSLGQLCFAPAMRMTAIHTQPERKRQDRSVRCAGKYHRRTRTRRLPSLIRLVPAASATTDTAQGGKCLSRRQIQANPTSEGLPLGECRLPAFTGGFKNDIKKKSIQKQM